MGIISASPSASPARTHDAYVPHRRRRQPCRRRDDIRNLQKGIVKYHDLNAVEVPDAASGKSRRIVLKRNGELAIHDDKNRELERYKVPYGAEVMVQDGQAVDPRTQLVLWDSYLTPILAEVSGFVRFQDILEGETVRLEQERAGAKYVVIEHKGEKHPQVIIEDKEGKVLEVHYLPAKARIELEEGHEVIPGMLLARQPRAISGTQDITGGLPRVTEIFEARKPKEPAVMAEISGTVEILADKRRGKMTIVVRSESGMEKEHHIPQDKRLLVHAGDYVEAGDPLIEGPLVPHDILRVKGEEALQVYLLNEVQAVYRSQNVGINDKHLEVIINQMLRKVKIEGPGDSKFLPGEVVDKFRFRAENDRLGKSVKIKDPGDSEFQAGQIVPKGEFDEVVEQSETDGGTPPTKDTKPRPATAKTLRLDLDEVSGDLDILARYGEPLVANGEAGNTAISPLGRESLVIDGASPQPLRPGRWYVNVVHPVDFGCVDFALYASFSADPPPALLVIPPLPMATDPRQRAVQATVDVSSEYGGASGTLLTDDGLVLTNYHVVTEVAESAGEDCPVVIAATLAPQEPPRELFRGRVLKFDKNLDLALIRIACGFYRQPLPKGYRFPWIPLGNSAALDIGDTLSIVGFPSIGGTAGRVSVTLTQGVLSGFERTTTGSLMKTDANISPGSSGGAALDSRWRLIGVPTFENVNPDSVSRMSYIYPVSLVPPSWRALIEKRQGSTPR